MIMIEFQHELDARKQPCPNPVVMTRQAFKSMGTGDVLHVISTDPVSVQHIGMLLNAIHYELIDSNDTNGEFHFYIKKC